MAVAPTSPMTIYTELISWVYESIGEWVLQKGIDFGFKVTDKTLGNDGEWVSHRVQYGYIEL